MANYYAAIPQTAPLANANVENIITRAPALAAGQAHVLDHILTADIELKTRKRFHELAPNAVTKDDVTCSKLRKVRVVSEQAEAMYGGGYTALVATIATNHTNLTNQINVLSTQVLAW